MDLSLKDQVVLVAGSSRGIGKAIAASFLREQCRTVITGRNSETLGAARAELEAEYGSGRLMACAGDLTDAATIATTLARVRECWGGLDCLVANIGSGKGKSGWEVDESDWQSLFEVNLWASVRLVSAVIRPMMEAGHGSLVLIASITGVERTPAPLPYSAAKAALLSFAKNLSRLAGTYNVRINCVAPGNILFPGGSWERHLAARQQEVMEMIKAEVPLQRFGLPQEIADLVVFLSSKRASFITGACVIADGGQTRTI